MNGAFQPEQRADLVIHLLNGRGNPIFKPFGACYGRNFFHHVTMNQDHSHVRLEQLDLVVFQVLKLNRINSVAFRSFPAG